MLKLYDFKPFLFSHTINSLSQIFEESKKSYVKLIMSNKILGIVIILKFATVWVPNNKFIMRKNRKIEVNRIPNYIVSRNSLGNLKLLLLL